MNRRVFTIALHEYVTNVRRKEFILITLGLPLLMLAFGGLSVLGTMAAVGPMMARMTRGVGIVDDSGALNLQGTGSRELPEGRLIVYPDEAAGQADVRADRIAALVVVSREYLETGQVTVYRRGGSILNQGERLPIGAILTRALLARAGADQRLIRRAVEPTGGGVSRVFVLDKAGQFVPRSGAREAARFVVPYVFSILLTTAIFIAANYLLRGIADEKENRVIEVILSSVTAEDLLRGKLIGLAGVGLTQVGVWMALGGIPAMIRFAGVIHITPFQLLGVALYFALGFGLYATMMAGLGALGTSYRESQQIAGLVSMGAFFPFLLIPVLIEFPNGPLARAFSFIPFTAPTTMVLRVTATDVPPMDIVLSAALILLTIWLVLKLSAKLFRFGLLIYGKRPSFSETLRWLRQA